MQWDYGDGPVVEGRSTVLFCAWLAWSRYHEVPQLQTGYYAYWSGLPVDGSRSTSVPNTGVASPPSPPTTT